MGARPRNALVTGATGFLGGKLARRLHADGWRVTAVGRNRDAGRKLSDVGISFARIELADSTAVNAACREQDIVFHCAARSSPWGRSMDFQRDNIFATRHVIAACESQRVSRLIHVSTPSVYFDFTDRFNISESHLPASPPANHYARTKLLAEAEIDAAAARGLHVITLRPRAIFGPGDNTLFPRLIRAHGRHGFPLIGNTDPLMDITYVENVVDAMLLAADAPTAALGRKFNVTNGEPWPRLKLLSQLFTEIGVPLRTRQLSYSTAHRLAAIFECASNIFTLGRWEPTLTRYTVGVIAKSQTLDISSARTALGYRPKVSVEEGLRAFGAWWKEDGNVA